MTVRLTITVDENDPPGELFEMGMLTYHTYCVTRYLHALIYIGDNTESMINAFVSTTDIGNVKKPQNSLTVKCIKPVVGGNVYVQADLPSKLSPHMFSKAYWYVVMMLCRLAEQLRGDRKCPVSRVLYILFKTGGFRHDLAGNSAWERGFEMCILVSELHAGMLICVLVDIAACYLYILNL